MRDGTSPEDRHATQDYLRIQDFMYPIINEYELQGRYEFFTMLAAEMTHLALLVGKMQKMSEQEVIDVIFEDVNERRRDDVAWHKFARKILEKK